MTDMTMTVVAMAGGQGSQQGAAGLLGMLVPMLLIFAIFYFMLIRPQQRREKERVAMVNAIKSGDRILFCGGMIGVVANVKEQERILVVKVADNTKVEIARGAVLRVLGKDEKDIEANG